jgi:transposase
MSGLVGAPCSAICRAPRSPSANRDMAATAASWIRTKRPSWLGGIVGAGQRRSTQPLPAVTEVPRRPLTPRRATWLVLRPVERSTEQDRHQLAQLTQQAPELTEAVALAQDFAALVRQRQPTQLESWLKRAATSALPPFRRFAKGLRADLAAVQAAVTLPWSQGPIEGHINRLKLLKRQMFGRARLDLLARRFLLAA